MSDTPETDAFFDHAISTKNRYPEYCAPFESFCQKLEREKNAAIKELENLKASSIHTCHDQCQRPMCVLRRERDNWCDMHTIAAKELSSIHQWIERNHPDGFIDSLTHSQNLDRVTDNWYDRYDRLEVDA